MKVKTIRFIYLTVLGLVFAITLPSIITHTIWMMGGQGLPFILMNRWDIAAINIAFFIFFIFLIRYKRHVDWRSRNIYAAFIIALFAEMYGFPLTAYFMANYFGSVNVDYSPAYTITFRFLDVWFTLPTMMIIGGAITVIGLFPIVVGWYQVYKSEGKIVSDGLYRYSRHPQYVGILFVTFGWIIHWPTLPTIIMWPVLAVIYYRLAREEEEWVLKDNPSYSQYRKNTPMFI